MAISYPLALPGSQIKKCVRRLVPQISRAPTRGGLQQAVELGVALWRVDYETVHLNAAESAAWESFIDQLKGGIGYFKATHPGRPLPVGRTTSYSGAVQAGTATPFDGTGTLSVVNTTLSRITLQGLPVTASWAPGLLPGDVVSVATSGGGRQLFRTPTGGTGNNSGILQLDDCLPAVKSNIVVGAAYSIVDPWFEAVLDDKSVQWRDEVGFRSLAFTGWQVVR